jgi:arginine:ornithine antiporter/lysine permease
VFLGVEGASVYSRHARRRRDVGRATVLGFASVLALFASVSVVSYGILPADQLAALRQPSMAGVLEAAVGGWGSVLVSVGLVVSVLGAYLAWTLMAAEVLLVAARDGDLPRFLARSDTRDTPVPALFLTSALAQVLLLVTLLSADAFDFALDLTATLAIVPYVLAAGFAVRVGVHDRRRTETVVAVLATAYTLFLLVAAGPAYLLVVLVVYAPASVLFARARHEAGRRAFGRVELAGLAAICVGAVVGIVCLATGAVHL